MLYIQAMDELDGTPTPSKLSYSTQLNSTLHSVTYLRLYHRNSTTKMHFIKRLSTSTSTSFSSSTDTLTSTTSTIVPTSSPSPSSKSTTKPFTSATTTTNPVHPPKKDYEAAYAALSSQYGFGGSAPSVPTLPSSSSSSKSKSKNVK